MQINIEEYLSADEIKDIVQDEVGKHVRNCIGEVSVSADKGRVLIGQLAKQLAKEGTQESQESELDTMYGVDKSWNLVSAYKTDIIPAPISDYYAECHWEETDEDRQEYIEYNKPCISQKEIMEDILPKLELKRGIPLLDKEDMETIKCALDNYVMEKLKQ